MPKGLSESAKALNERRKTKNIRSGGESVERFKALRTKLTNSLIFNFYSL